MDGNPLLAAAESFLGLNGLVASRYLAGKWYILSSVVSLSTDSEPVVATLACVAWDHVLTTRAEARYIWTLKYFNVNRVIYTLNRYGTETGLLYVTYCTFSRIPLPLG